MSTQKETIIKITPMGEVEVTTVFEDDSMETKVVAFDDMLNAIRSSVEKESDSVVMSPVLPYNEKFGVRTVSYKNFADGREQIVMFKKAHRCDIVYHSQKIEDVGMPNLLFAVMIKDHKVTKAHVVAVKDDTISDRTPIYHYPFSNASGGNGSICFGANKIYDYEYKDLSHLFSLPSMFLDMPNNDHMYGKNNSGLSYRPLLEKLSHNDFDNNILKETSTAFKKWYTDLIGGGY